MSKTPSVKVVRNQSQTGVNEVSAMQQKAALLCGVAIRKSDLGLLPSRDGEYFLCFWRGGLDRYLCLQGGRRQDSSRGLWVGEVKPRK